MTELEALTAASYRRIEKAASTDDPERARAIGRAFIVELAGHLSDSDLAGVVASARDYGLDEVEPDVFSALVALDAARQARLRARRDAVITETTERLRANAFRTAQRAERVAPAPSPPPPEPSWLEIRRDEDGAMSAIVKHVGDAPEPPVDFDAELARLFARAEGGSDA